MVKITCQLCFKKFQVQNKNTMKVCPKCLEDIPEKELFAPELEGITWEKVESDFKKTKDLG